MCFFNISFAQDNNLKNNFAEQEKQEDISEAPVLPSEIGKVLSVEDFGYVKTSTDGTLNQAKQSVEILVIKGEHKGEKIILDNMLMGNPYYDLHLKKGDKVILHAEQGEGCTIFDIADKQRTPAINFLIFLFFALLLAVGRKKGLYSLVSILVTLGLIFYVLTPLVLHGINPIISTIFVCILSSVIAIYLVGGINKKSTAAVLGIVLSLIFSGILSLLTIKICSLTGFSEEESLFLLTAYPDLNFVGILASGMLIGALGALMDIGMSISSTVNELFTNSPELSLNELFNSGMNVGKDIIGTMANTLILAYLGGSLSLVLLANQIDLQKFFNLNQVSTEISSALVGSISIVICVPITAYISAYMLLKNKTEQEEKINVEENVENSHD